MEYSIAGSRTCSFMKKPIQSVNLLIIDDEQTTANKLIEQLKQQDIEVQFTLVDDQKALQKALRASYDVIILGQAYDLDYRKVLQLLVEQETSTPVITLLKHPESSADFSLAVSQYLQAGLADAIARDDILHITAAIQREYYYSSLLRQNQQLAQQMLAAEQRMQLLVKSSRSAVAYIHEGIHLYTNEAYNQLFGYTTHDDLTTIPIVDLISPKDAAKFKEFLKAYQRDELQQEFEFSGLRADGQEFVATLQLAPSIFESESCIQVIIQPNRESYEFTPTAKVISDPLDQLTGLPLRGTFELKLKEELARLKRDKRSKALFFISIDHIGHIHANFGLAGSDTTVAYIANLLKTYVAPQQLYRFGESTFTVLIEESQSQVTTELAHQLCKLVEGSLIPFNSKSIQTTISIGITIINDHAPENAELLDQVSQAAEKVRLQNKGAGNGVFMHISTDNANSTAHQLKETLEQSIQQGKLKIMFQHIYDTDNLDNEFFEAYVRLPLDDGKLLTPDVFLPIAQQYQLEGQLDRWVLLNAFKQLKAFITAYPQARLLINLGAESLQDKNLPDVIQKLLTALDNPTHHPIILQFSETTFSNYAQIAKVQIDRLHQVGCQVSISDFGSSLNSKNLLNHLSVDLVKLDKTYMQDLEIAQNYQATQTLIQHIQPYNIAILGSYIESTQNISKAWNLGIRYLQGYYFQKPCDTLSLTHEEHI